MSRVERKVSERGPKTGVSLGVLRKETGWSGGGRAGMEPWNSGEVGCLTLCPVSLETGCGHLDQIWVPKSEAASSFEIQAGTGAVPGTPHSAA